MATYPIIFAFKILHFFQGPASRRSSVRGMSQHSVDEQMRRSMSLASQPPPQELIAAHYEEDERNANSQSSYAQSSSGGDVGGGGGRRVSETAYHGGSGNSYATHASSPPARYDRSNNVCNITNSYTCFVMFCFLNTQYEHFFFSLQLP